MKQPAAMLGLPRKLPRNAPDIVASAVRHAWTIICSNPAVHLAPPAPGNPPEDIYSDAIRELLMGMLRNPAQSVPGFSDLIFRDVVRGGNVFRYDLKSINKQPDLFVRVAGSDPNQIGSHVGLFIEAKIVTPGKGVANYTDHGVKRFVDGDYGWAMQDGMMLAYQHAPGQPLSVLDKRLGKGGALATVEVGGAILQQAPSPHICGLSVHARTWLHNDGTKPGNIHVWHVWDLPIPAGVGALSAPPVAPSTGAVIATPATAAAVGASSAGTSGASSV